MSIDASQAHDASSLVDVTKAIIRVVLDDAGFLLEPVCDQMLEEIEGPCLIDRDDLLIVGSGDLVGWT